MVASTEALVDVAVWSVGGSKLETFQVATTCTVKQLKLLFGARRNVRLYEQQLIECSATVGLPSWITTEVAWEYRAWCWSSIAIGLDDGAAA